MRIVLYPGKRITFTRDEKSIRAVVIKILKDSCLCLIDGEVEKVFFEELFR